MLGCKGGWTASTSWLVDVVGCAALINYRCIQRLPGVETEDSAAAFCSAAQV